MVLPLTTRETDDEASPDEAPLTNSGELVLLVEDDPSVRRVVRQQLVDLGYPVIEAENGVQGLEMIEQIADIAIVVSDVIMPGGINGRQLAAAVLGDHPHMRIVLMSGYTDEATGDVGNELPVLAKPFAAQDLARALQGTNRGKP